MAQPQHQRQEDDGGGKEINQEPKVVPGEKARLTEKPRDKVDKTLPVAGVGELEELERRAQDNDSRDEGDEQTPDALPEKSLDCAVME